MTDGQGRHNDLDMQLFGPDLLGGAWTPKRGPLVERFTVPPFTVLDARAGYWIERKRAWRSIGLKGELGRGEGAMETYDLDLDPTRYGGYQSLSTTSIFDPVLTECCYRWFCPPGGQIIDPFAGGSTRGIVAAMLGLKYWGCDLYGPQIEANEEQANEILGFGNYPRPEWLHGDSKFTLAGAPFADLIFTCPPYGDLEVYSDDPRDISTHEYPQFLAMLRSIMLRAYDRLADDRFYVMVVADFRDKAGRYRNFVADTIDAADMVGLDMVSHAVLLTPNGTAPIRASAHFDAGRLLVRAHQNVLIFVKGDRKEAAAWCTGGIQ